MRFSRLRDINIVVRIAVAVVATPAIIIGLSVLLALRITDLPANAAFRVGDTVVTKTELAKRLQLLKALYGIQAPPDPGKRETFRRESARAVALSMVLDRAASDAGVVAEEKDVHDAFVALQGANPDGRNGFVKLLGEVGASEQDVLDEITRQQTTSRLYEKVVAARAGEVAVTEQEAQRYYDENPSQFVQPESRHIRNIVVSTQGDATEVLGKAQAGADFGQLAKEYSLDQSTRDIGGDLGFVAAAKLADSYAAAAFAAPGGGLFGPVRAEKGWNVGQVLEVRPAVPLPFAQVFDQLRDFLKSEKSLELWRGWVSDQVKNAHVQYADEYRPSDPDAPIASTGSEPAAPKPEVPR